MSEKFPDTAFSLQAPGREAEENRKGPESTNLGANPALGVSRRRDAPIGPNFATGKRALNGKRVSAERIIFKRPSTAKFRVLERLRDALCVPQTSVTRFGLVGLRNPYAGLELVQQACPVT